MTQPPTPSPLNYQPPTAAGFNWGDFFAFRTMITVPIIKILFLVCAGLSVLIGFGIFVSGFFVSGGIMLIIAGLFYMIIGPVLVRIYCEILIVIFRINETLGEIRKDLSNR